MSPLFSVTTFNWSPYLQLQNTKLNLSNVTVTSPFNREIIVYELIGILLRNKQIKPKKIAKLNIKNPKTKLLLLLLILPLLSLSSLLFPLFSKQYDRYAIYAIYIYICIYMYIDVYIYIHIY